MDSINSGNSRSVRRSTRQASVKVLSYEPSPRGPLKRTKRAVKNKSPTRRINGTKDEQAESEEDESPKKKSKEEEDQEWADDQSEDKKMDVEEQNEDVKKMEDERTSVSQGTGVIISPRTLPPGFQGDVNFYPRVELRKRCPPSLTVGEDPNWREVKKVKTEQKYDPSGKPAPKNQFQIKNHVPPKPLIRNISQEYRRTMEMKAKSTDLPKVCHMISSRPRASQNFNQVQQSVREIPTRKAQLSNQGRGQTNTCSVKRFSCTGFPLCLCGLVLVLLLGCAALQLHRILPTLKATAGGRLSPSKPANIEEFANHFSRLQAAFPSQRSEVWKWSRIHLEKHLTTEEPTEPVSLILTAGPEAERTLKCLAQGFSSSFSAARSASVLHIDGAAKAGEDSDKAKLEIDNQLRSAFEGDKPAAVIHRFEELPPDSTIIFYRYCDHESAAYKDVFLLFTVLLPENELSGDMSMKEVEERVQDFVKDKLVSPQSHTTFNKMDLNKFGGLWSRISHLILPVVSEDSVEKNGC